MKINFKQLLNPVKPDWRKISILIALFLVLPQKIDDEFILFGGVYIIKSLFESKQPVLDLTIIIVILTASYFIACFLVWIYDKKINKFILSEGEVEVQPEEKKEEKIEQKVPGAKKETKEENK